MRCNRHVSDLSSSVGVCASCLRERLLVLIAAQVEENRRKTEDRRKSDAPPLVFPRSVSPYICRRSDDSSWHKTDPRRFYSTPQIGPTFDSCSSKKKNNSSSSGKFSLLSTLFRSSRSGNHPDPLSSDPRFTSTTSSPISSAASTTSSSSSWFSSLLSGRRKKHSRSRFVDEAQQPPRLHRRARDQGMSPTNVDPNFDTEDGSPSGSGNSSEGWKKTPSSATCPSARRRGGSSVHNRNVSGLAFCLSPLVRASPNNHRCQKDANLPPIGLSCEIPRKSTKAHLSAASLCPNRSRKLADFGRYNYNNP